MFRATNNGVYKSKAMQVLHISSFSVAYFSKKYKIIFLSAYLLKKKKGITTQTFWHIIHFDMNR